MEKKCVLVIFGGASSEHEVSRKSAACIIRNIPEENYEIKTLGITKNGEWFLYNGDSDKIENGEWENDEQNKKRAFISPDTSIKGLIVLENNEYKTIGIDCIIPVLHGKNGEDGTVQGLFSLAKIPFVGCDLLSSASCMDKITTNIMLSAAGIKKAKFAFVYTYEFEKNQDAYLDYIEKAIGSYPMFVKPSNAGSSVGVTKADNRDKLIEAISIAAKEDSRILIEENIVGQEVECAIIGNYEPVASIVGEIAPAKEFYDYEAKYISDDSKLYIPAHLSEETSNKIRKTAATAYKIMGCTGLSRVDFFVQEGTNEIFLNEINTFPGFTSISMYPKLMEKIGLSCPELIDTLIRLAFERIS